ncbi:MAG TPA: CDGSH iron-sulfur domain-containing protein [Caulobacteraceae bacterium]|jgi:CDGSH-type Zn-finger protein
MAQSLAASGMKITIVKDGPYQVSGDVPLKRATIGADKNGESRDWLPGETVEAHGVYELCRCGHSANKPFCDNTHEAIGFDGSETASRAPYDEQAGVMEGPAIALADAEPLCAFARFCDRDGNVWNTVSAVAPGAQLDAFVSQVGQCPSGRLRALDLSTGVAEEPDLSPSIALVSDPAQGVAGPLWVTDGIAIVGADGFAYERRNRATLCRCGASKNKPFCDGSHASEGVMFEE